MAADSAGARAGEALRIHALARPGWGRGLPEGWRLVESGPVAAAVRPEAEGDGGLRAHVRRVEALGREVPLVPLPPGLRARDRDAVRAFLERARLPVLEALDLCQGCWELRVHLAGGDRASGAVGEVHRALRRRSRAVRRLPAGKGTALSAAYLVARPRWIGFVEEAARREGTLAGLAVDVTGPWAAWDFVRVFPEGAP